MHFHKIHTVIFSLLSIILVPAIHAQEVAQNTPKQLAMNDIDFKYETDKIKWRTVNDGVMGGQSDGNSFLTEAGNRIFTGEISLENNGGFSSVRTDGATYDLSSFDGVSVRVRGDGRSYFFTARTSDRGMIAYWFPVQTKAGEWTTVKVPFSDMYPTSFGRKIAGAPLDVKQIKSFGFMLYDKVEGGFNLEIESIKVYNKK